MKDLIRLSELCNLALPEMGELIKKGPDSMS
jgi:hypothetical protein